ncbi:MAG: FecR domain-containing protein [Pseudomonadota bacterium]
MNPSASKLRAPLAILAAACVAAAAPAAAESEIGAVGASAPRIEGTPPELDPRVLETGVRVIRNERIQTSDSGVGQILFDDQSTLSVAPNSDLTLDQYVYNPATGAGEISMTLTKGAMRFIGGRITKTQDAVVRTPTGTMGIRGGMALFTVQDDGSVEVVNLGALYVSVKTASESLFLSRASAFAVVRPNGRIVFGGKRDLQQTGADFALFKPRRGVVSPKIATFIAEANNTSPAFNEAGATLRVPVSTDGADNDNGELVADDFVDLLERVIFDPEFEVEVEAAPPPEDSGPGELQQALRAVALNTLLVDSIGFSEAQADEIASEYGVFVPQSDVIRILTSNGLLNDQTLADSVRWRVLRQNGFEADFVPNPELATFLLDRWEERGRPTRFLKRVARIAATEALETSPKAQKAVLRRVRKELRIENPEASIADAKAYVDALSPEDRAAFDKKARNRLARQILNKKIKPDLEERRARVDDLSTPD